MSERRRYPPDASEARGTGGGGRRGARQSRAEGARARESGAWRSGGREAAEPPTHSIADGTALRNIVGEEVAATFESSRIRPRALLFLLFVFFLSLRFTPRKFGGKDFFLFFFFLITIGRV